MTTIVEKEAKRIKKNKLIVMFGFIIFILLIVVLSIAFPSNDKDLSNSNEIDKKSVGGVFALVLNDQKIIEDKIGFKNTMSTIYGLRNQISKDQNDTKKMWYATIDDDEIHEVNTADSGSSYIVNLTVDKKWKYSLLLVDMPHEEFSYQVRKSGEEFSSLQKIRNENPFMEKLPIIEKYYIIYTCNIEAFNLDSGKTVCVELIMNNQKNRANIKDMLNNNGITGIDPIFLDGGQKRIVNTDQY